MIVSLSLGSGYVIDFTNKLDKTKKSCLACTKEHYCIDMNVYTVSSLENQTSGMVKPTRGSVGYR
jgi:hypothetical protein